jgi:ABC-type uncharacterized transport system auxiliary subunit
MKHLYQLMVLAALGITLSACADTPTPTTQHTETTDPKAEKKSSKNRPDSAETIVFPKAGKIMAPSDNSLLCPPEYSGRSRPIRGCY